MTDLKTFPDDQITPIINEINRLRDDLIAESQKRLEKITQKQEKTTQLLKKSQQESLIKSGELAVTKHKKIQIASQIEKKNTVIECLKQTIYRLNTAASQAEQKAQKQLGIQQKLHELTEKKLQDTISSLENQKMSRHKQNEQILRDLNQQKASKEAALKAEIELKSNHNQTIESRLKDAELKLSAASSQEQSAMSIVSQLEGKACSLESNNQSLTDTLQQTQAALTASQAEVTTLSEYVEELEKKNQSIQQELFESWIGDKKTKEE